MLADLRGVSQLGGMLQCSAISEWFSLVLNYSIWADNWNIFHVFFIKYTYEKPSPVLSENFTIYNFRENLKFKL